MNRKIRQNKQFYKYKKRIANVIAGKLSYQTREGVTIYNPTVQDVIDDNGMLKLKTMATRCSCYCCSGMNKYKRNDKKVEDRKLIQCWIVEEWVDSSDD